VFSSGGRVCSRELLPAADLHKKGKQAKNAVKRNCKQILYIMIDIQTAESNDAVIEWSGFKP